ncbi:MAG: beta-N-acetylhexosaminidase [Magnetococcales bacterium]|nr:beta-N-acetylhexosaminidase [Magnetococcales bacterium]NGZ06755.1 beta-N-acetylhexosaminidase [Magnetococcales bacterium]
MKPQIHLIIALQGPEPSEAELTFLNRVRPAGVILFGRNLIGVKQISTLIKAIGDTAGAPTIWIDQEGGRVQRLRDPLTRYPSPYQFAVLARTDPIRAERLLFTAGRLCGEELGALGIGVNCAPVLDIREAEADPVIGDRAFGSHFSEVIMNATSWLHGFRQTGVMPIGKHFPGHGAALADSHHALPVLDKSIKAMEKWELNPFRAVLPHLPGIMTAHLALSRVDDGVPATWSRTLLHKLLRQKWRYPGVIVSDALEMKALHGTMEERARLAMMAGCDLLLCCTGRMEDNEAVIEGIARATKAMDAQEVEASRRRVRHVLAPYRLQPGSIRRLLKDPGYRKRRQQVEAVAEEVFALDPTIPLA